MPFVLNIALTKPDGAYVVWVGQIEPRFGLGLGWGWLCRVSRRHRLPMVLVGMVGRRGAEVAWRVFRFLIALGPGIPFYWLGLWSFFVQGPDSLEMACL